MRALLGFTIFVSTILLTLVPAGQVDLFALQAQEADHSAQAPSAPATTPQAPPTPCTGDEYRQFDFWLGQWQVKNVSASAPPANALASNRISSIHAGCVLHEEYKNGAYTGSSFSYFDQASGQWRQTWVDNQGGSLRLAGKFEDGTMVLLSESATNAPIQRIRWSSKPDGSVRQLWDTSTDGGETWAVAFDGLYTAKK